MDLSSLQEAPRLIYRIRAKPRFEVGFATDERASLPRHSVDQVTGPDPIVHRTAPTNAAKYANATDAGVELRRDDGVASVEVADDGVGGANPADGSGLRGLVVRNSALDGTFEVDSRSGQETTARAAIPCK
jgi:nitrate/nitrite-specific signal transduction histidine kinase